MTPKPTSDSGTRDPMGKAALFTSASEKRSNLGTISLECSACKRETPVGWVELLSLMLPLPVTIPRHHHTWMKCPSCGRRAWMRARWRI